MNYDSICVIENYNSDVNSFQPSCFEKVKNK